MMKRYDWNVLADGETRMMFVPGGMIVAVSDIQESGNGISTAISAVFVPCSGESAAEWLGERVEAST